MLLRQKIELCGITFMPDINLMFPSGQLPVGKRILEMLIALLHPETSGKNRRSKDDAYNLVTELLIEHWEWCNIYTKTRKQVRSAVEALYDDYNYIKKHFKKREKSPAFVKNLENFKFKVYHLFDIKVTDPQRQKRLEDENRIKMSEDEILFYEDQKANTESERKRYCENYIERRWLKTITRIDQRQASLNKKIKKSQLTENESVNSEVISDTEEPSTDSTFEPDKETEKQGKKRPYSAMNNRNSHLPSEYRKIRTSERCVQEKVYETLACLQGEGLSMQESLNSFKIVSKGFFDYQFSLPTEESEITDYTLPDIRNVRKHTQLEETRRLDLITEKIEEEKSKGKMISMAGDSTTRKAVGKFAVAGVHVGKDNILPLPTLSVSSETTDNVSETVSTPIEMLGAASGKKPAEIYKNVDVHVSDSVSHNLSIASDLKEKYSREDQAGQVFCNAHTSLGLIEAINTKIHEIEEKVGVNNIFKQVLVEVSYEKKHSSIVAQVVYSLLSLIDREHSAKTWNYHEDFLDWLRRNNIKSYLFTYKDCRFDGLPRACSVVLFYWQHIQTWLKERSDIDNKLACFIRSIQDISYLPLALTVISTFGILLIEPFNANN